VFSTKMNGSRQSDRYKDTLIVAMTMNDKRHRCVIGVFGSKIPFRDRVNRMLMQMEILVMLKNK